MCDPVEMLQFFSPLSPKTLVDCRERDGIDKLLLLLLACCKHRMSSDDKPRIPTVSDVELFDYIPPEREVSKRLMLTQKMNELLKVFERDNAGVIDVREVGTVLRAMGINPTEAEVLQVVEAIEEESTVGFVRSDKLCETVVNMIMMCEFKGKVLARDSESTILKAFEVLDREGKGFIPCEYLKELLTTMGERFSGEEMLEMVNAAADPETGNIYYEEFASILATE